LRSIARQLYQAWADLPIISPHGHVPAQWLADDTAFADPTSLLITPDHYVQTGCCTHTGWQLSDLGVGQGALTEAESREAFRIVCFALEQLPGTPVRYWFDSQLAEIFGVKVRPSADTADEIYDQIAECLSTADIQAASLIRQVPTSRCWQPPTILVMTWLLNGSCATTRPGTVE
jgi:glucuronate isomerase